MFFPLTFLIIGYLVTYILTHYTSATELPLIINVAGDAKAIYDLEYNIFEDDMWATEILVYSSVKICLTFVVIHWFNMNPFSFIQR